MKNFTEQVNKNLLTFSKRGVLFTSTLSGDKLFNQYLLGFKEDPVFRDPESSSHNCNNCKHTLRRYGNIISINPDTLELESIFDNIVSEEYGDTAKKLSEILKSTPIDGYFYESFDYLKIAPYESCKNSNSMF